MPESEIELFIEKCDKRFDSKAVILNVSSFGAELLCRNSDKLAAWASKRKFTQALIYWDECGGRPYKIPASLASNKPKETEQNKDLIEPGVFGYRTSLSLPVVRALEEMILSDRPMALINLETQKQEWINAPMEQMLATPAVIATERIMTNFWRPQDLAELKQKCQQHTRFSWTYSAGLNETTWAQISTKFKIIDGRYRLATNISYQPVPLPHDFVVQ